MPVETYLEVGAKRVFAGALDWPGWCRSSRHERDALEALLGWEYTGQEFSNGDISFTRFPLDLVASLALGTHRVGLGPTIHLAPTFACDARICGGGLTSVSMPTAFGLIAQWAYRYSYRDLKGEIGMRYTRISYGIEDYEPLDGSSIGFFFGAML